MKQIESGTPAVKGPYFKAVFRRSDRVKEQVGVFEWVKLTALELLVGEELLEQLSITAAYNESEKSKLGHLLHLADLVPAGLVTNYFRQSIYQLLYYKFYRHYLFLASESTLDPSTREDEDGRLDFRRDRFAVRHDLLYQLIAFRRVYVVSWVVFNVVIDIAVWLLSDLQTALLAALSIEAIRRLLRW